MKLALGYISIACDAIIFGVLICLTLVSERTITRSTIYFILGMSLVAMIAKAASDHSHK